MDFTLSEDHSMLADTFRRFLAEAWDVETRASLAYEPPYHDPQTWTGMAEMGVLAALVGPDAGGFGGTGVDIMVLFEQVGATLAAEPLLGALLAARVLEEMGAHDRLDQVLSGAVRPVLAWAEPHDLDTATDLRTVGATDGTTSTVTGRKSVVYGGPGADVAVVSAMTEGGIGLWWVDLADAAVTDHGLIDGGGAGEVVLDDTPAELLTGDGEGPLAATLDAGRLALCAEAVGAMQSLYDMTVSHLQSRRQFDRTLASFQTLQHRVVDLALELEQARSITILAAASLGTEDGPRHVAMAKHLVGRAARTVAEEGIQLHGGIGMTWEYPGAHVAKRLVMIDHQLGDADFHLRRLTTDLAA